MRLTTVECPFGDVKAGELLDVDGETQQRTK